MTVSTTSVKSIGLGNGATTLWTYNFLINLATDVEVTYTDATGVNTTIGSSLYSITGLTNPAGGTLTYPLSGPAIANGTKLTISRNAPDTQLIDLVSQGSFSPDVVETGLDNVVLELQQTTERGTRSIRAPISDSSPSMLLPSDVVRANTVLAFDGTGNVAVIPAASSSVSISVADSSNVVVNPDSAVAQLGTSISGVADNAYTGDGVRTISEANGDTNWQQWATAAQLAPTAKFGDYGQVAVINKKFGLFRPLEGKDIWQLRGLPAIFSAYVYADASLGNIKMGLLQWTGAEDAISADPISVWNADGVTPTLAAGWSFVNVPANIGATTTPTRFQAIGTISAAATNLGLLVWNDDKVTTLNQGFVVSQWDLRPGSILLPFQPVNLAASIARCERYFEKSFRLTSAPAQTSGEQYYLTCPIAGATAFSIGIPFRVRKRTSTATVVTFNPLANNVQVRNFTRSTDSTGAGSANVDEVNFRLQATGAVGWVAGDNLGVSFTADARL